MMMVPYMFNDDLMDDLFNDNWERDFDRAMHSMQPRHMFGKRSANAGPAERLPDHHRQPQ